MCHRSSSTTLASESSVVVDGGRPWLSRCSSARCGASGRPRSTVPRHTETASRSVMQHSQRPRSPEVDTPHRRSAFLMVRPKDALDWGAARKATSTVVPRSERKHAWSAQCLAAHICKTGTSWSRRSNVPRKAFDVKVNADICLNAMYVFGDVLSAKVDTRARRRLVEKPRHGDTSLKHAGGEPRWTAEHVRPHRKTQHCDTLPEKQKDKHEKRSMVRRRPGQPPYIDVIDVASHAPLRPWKTPVSSDEALRHCKPSACLSDIGTRCQAEHCADESVGRLLQQTLSATAQNR